MPEILIGKNLAFEFLQKAPLSPASRMIAKLAIDSVPVATDWIPCSELMPDKDSGIYPCVFLVWNDLQPDIAGIYSAYPHIGFYNWNMKGWQDDAGNVYFDSDGYVTHWFPMPAIPLFPKRLKEGAET